MIRLLALVLIFISGQASADCMDEANDQVSMNKCAYSLERESMGIVKELEERVKKVLPKEQKAIFIQSQDLWKGMKNNDCMITEWYLGRGSARGMSVSLCHHERNKQRIDQIRYFLCHPMLECDEAKEYEYTFNKSLQRTQKMRR